MSPPAGSLASLLLRKQGTVFAASLLAGFGVTLATGRPAHELLTHGALARSRVRGVACTRPRASPGALTRRRRAPRAADYLWEGWERRFLPAHRA
jgi:hypothetical protein